MTKRINATVPDDLYEFAARQNRGNKSYVVKEALECLRLFYGSLERARKAALLLEKKELAEND